MAVQFLESLASVLSGRGRPSDAHDESARQEEVQACIEEALAICAEAHDVSAECLGMNLTSPPH